MSDRPERIASVVGGDAGTVSPVEGELIFRLLVNSRLFGLSVRSLGRQLGGRFYVLAANRIGFHQERPSKAVLFAVIPDAAHYSWEDSTEVYLQHILDWTDKVESGR